MVGAVVVVVVELVIRGSLTKEISLSILATSDS